MKPHRAAAEWWLSTALGPHAFTAARKRPSSGRLGWPTAYTPRWIWCRRPLRTRTLTSVRERPHENSSSRERTPHASAARRATITSGLLSGLGPHDPKPDKSSRLRPTCTDRRSDRVTEQ